MNLRLLQAGLAAAGAGIAGYLVWARITDTTIACTTGGCEQVQRSSYAEIAGVPVAVLGLGAYLALLVLAAVPARWATQASAGIALAGVAFSVWLLFCQLVLIEAVCQWCLASDAVMTALAVVTLLRAGGSSAYSSPAPASDPRRS